ncbi:hypothetical protein OEB96_31165 [Paraliomyxa miuraensis]|nr:hypothetical protein [Paraliomyxa miuraensis]
MCEPVVGEDRNLCAVGVEIRGSVIDAIDEGAIAGAHVVGADESGAPVTRVVQTDANGRFALPVSVGRDADGALAESPRWTLQVSAARYLPFPGLLRPALPIDTSAIVEGSSAMVIDGASTTVALVARQSGGAVVSGVVEGARAAGTLVVAEGVVPAPVAVADLDGAFSLFDVGAGPVVIRGHRAGVELAPVPLEIGADDVSDVRLRVITEDIDAMAVVRGSVNIVDGGGQRATSVVLVPSSVYVEGLERGPVPLGLRAPAPPQAPSISSSFEIVGVPEGRYHVLAGVENDMLVRDPDTSIAGTQVPEIEIVAGQSFDLQSSFKITEALTVLEPGADALEEVGASPTFAWVDDASEDRYELVVHDALGTEVWRDDQIPRGTSGDRLEVPYGGPTLIPGMVYRFQVTSWSDGAQGSTALSRTEDLRGVFIVR